VASDICQTLGAGVYMVSGSSLMLENVEVTDNEAVKWGGGVFAWESVVAIAGRDEQTLPATSSTAL